MKNRFVSLLSEGLDSPVAIYLMLKQGFIPVTISFLTDKKKEKKMKEKLELILNQLRIYTSFGIKAYFLPHYNNLEIFKQKCTRKLTCILCKRTMYRIALKIAQIEDTNIIVTGEILGEQASQTIDNLKAYNDLFLDNIKLAPLIGCNKLDVIHLSKKIGLYDICSEKIDACTYFPQYPETRTKMRELDLEEQKISYDNLVKESFKKVNILKF